CCSVNSRSSRPIFEELKIAIRLNKPIIPVFTNEEYIPVHLQAQRSVKFNPSDLQISVEKIYSLILRNTEQKNTSE
ncbi:MAG: hypothetical protein ACXACC_10680, partial [Promethearchaeota archaeon]